MSNTLIIAELSANHGNKIQNAIETIRAAKNAGADAIKFQTYTPDTLTLNCDNDFFQINQGSLWDGETFYNLYQKAFTPWEWHEELFDYARSLDLIPFSTPFDETAVDFLENLNNPIYKIASFEIVDIPLIEYAASKGKPMIISSGIATEEEIKEAIEACLAKNNTDITLLKCTSSYPAPLEEANLLTIADMKVRFNVKVGLSDHTLGDITAISAVALGARVIEKHFILNRSIGGPDSDFSMIPADFENMVKKIRSVEKCLRNVTYSLSDKMKANRKFSRSLFAVSEIKKGEPFTKKNIRSIRPGDGISPKYLPQLLGHCAKRDIERGTPLLDSDLDSINKEESDQT